jgi:uncharacterized protein
MINDLRAREAAWAAVLLAGIAAALCASYASAALLGAGMLHSASGLAVAIAIRETSTLLVVAILMRRYLGLTLRDLGVVRPSAGDVALGIVVGLALIVVGEAITLLMGEKRSSSIYGALVRGDGISQTAALLMIGVWSPFVQEVVFRGAFLRALRERLPAAVSVAITALVFGAVHAASGLTAVVSSFVHGLALGALTLRRGTLTAAIASHITINLGLSAYVLLRTLFLHRAP